MSSPAKRLSRMAVKMIVELGELKVGDQVKVINDAHYFRKDHEDYGDGRWMTIDHHTSDEGGRDAWGIGGRWIIRRSNIVGWKPKTTAG